MASVRTQCRNAEMLQRRFQCRMKLWQSMEKQKMLDKKPLLDQSAIDWICGSGLSNWLEQHLGNDKDKWGLEMQKKQKIEVNEDWRNSLLEALKRKPQPVVRKKRVPRSRHQCKPCEKLSMRAFVAVASESTTHRSRSVPVSWSGLPSDRFENSSRRGRSLN
eukprot:gnl/MRDRNA2_/MRDRNA2_113571_c0_seq1.p1 gnl/MRDRNA2_/MRDRNA2_113571_c0~~gnl/MRDRNA2_/MRDRNA2_113571_c0_seq1.p1  ORF type:complete len:185 (+),score=24.03 gnl/MRDRNA2_/MRDRNA2_113571_c0_seq1:72-557(+)